MPKFYQLTALAVAAILCAGCGKAPKPILVGSQNSTAQVIVGEIVAQQLEHRLARKVERRLGSGAEAVVYQSLLTGEISLYPTFAGAVETVILREKPSTDPAVVLERSQTEISRTAHMELLPPLGYENPPAMVIQPADLEESRVATLSEAASGKTQWKIGMSFEVQERLDTIPAISTYQLPMGQAIRSMQPSRLFPALKKGEVTMIAADNTDGRLTLPEYRVLADDQHAFPPYQACVLVRQDSLEAEPRLRGILAELSGKFTTEAVRKMAADVDLKHREPAEVAAEFLARAGLK